MQELFDVIVSDAMVSQKNLQAGVFDCNTSRRLLHLQCGLDTSTLIVLKLLLQALDILLVPCTGPTLVVTNPDS